MDRDRSFITEPGNISQQHIEPDRLLMILLLHLFVCFLFFSTKSEVWQEGAAKSRFVYRYLGKNREREQEMLKPDEFKEMESSG